MAASIDEEIYRELRGEFIDESKDHLEDMEGALNAYYAVDLSAAETIDILKRNAHTIKGLANPFGFSLLCSIIHQFEDYLLSLKTLGSDEAVEIQKYIDTMAACLLQDSATVTDERTRSQTQAVVAMAPESSQLQDDDAIHVLVVTSSRTIFHKTAHELLSAGFKATHAESVREVFEQIAHHAPDIVIVSDILDILSGVDMVYALRAMPSTEQIPVIFMSSFGESYPDVQRVSQVVPIITLGADIKKEIERAVTDIELKYSDKKNSDMAKTG